MVAIEYSSKSLEDMQQLRSYIETNWGEDVATKVLRNMLKDIERLADFPLSGADLSHIINVSTTYRYVFSEKNYVFYRIDLDRIRIVRIIGEQQDIISQLFGSKIEPE